MATRFFPGSSMDAEVQTFQVRIRFQLRNTQAAAVRDLRFSLMVPTLETPWQSCLELNCSSPAWLRQDEKDNAYLVIPVDLLAPYGSKFIDVTATLAWRADGKPQGLAVPILWRDAEPYIPVKHDRIQVLAQKLKQESAQATARSIYTWIRDHIDDSGYAGLDRGALFALNQGHGDCTEMAYLFTALARAAGVAARFHSGYPVEGDAVLAPQRYHNWATFHDGTHWRLADPQGGRFFQSERFYVQFSTSPPAPAGPLAGAHRFHVDHPAVQAKMLP